MIWLLLLLIAAPLLELYVILQVASVIGGWETIALLLLMGLIGSWLLKVQGLATLGRISAAAAEGRPPTKELVDGLLILIAAAMMLAPGFVGDVIGFVLLLPLTRAPFRSLLLKRFEAGRYGSLFTASGAGGARFMGTFRAGSNVYDTTGSTRADEQRPELDS